MTVSRFAWVIPVVFLVTCVALVTGLIIVIAAHYAYEYIKSLCKTDESQQGHGPLVIHDFDDAQSSFSSTSGSVRFDFSATDDEEDCV